MQAATEMHRIQTNRRDKKRMQKPPACPLVHAMDFLIYGFMTGEKEAHHFHLWVTVIRGHRKQPNTLFTHWVLPCCRSHYQTMLFVFHKEENWKKKKITSDIQGQKGSHALFQNHTAASTPQRKGAWKKKQLSGNCVQCSPGVSSRWKHVYPMEMIFNVVPMCLKQKISPGHRSFIISQILLTIFNYISEFLLYVNGLY